MIRKIFLGVLTVSVLSTLARAQPAAAPATQPLSQQDPTVAAVKTGANGTRFLQMHEKFLERAKQGNIDLLFLGDSITEGWGKALQVWKDNYEPLHVANFGIGGDRTQHVLWRIENGELDGIHPKVCVLMIGTNNTNSDPADKIAAAVDKIVKEVQEKTSAKVLLLAVFPRERKQDKPDQMETIKQINERLAKLDNGKTIRYLDIGPKFMGPDGHLNQKLFSDGLHPNVEGYQVWADAMKPLLDEMMKQ
jgi:lysophospholipase L1-like esterase